MNNEIGYAVVENGTVPLGILPLPLSAAFKSLDRYKERGAHITPSATYDVRPVMLGRPVLRPAQEPTPPTAAESA